MIIYGDVWANWFLVLTPKKVLSVLEFLKKQTPLEIPRKSKSRDYLNRICEKTHSRKHFLFGSE